MLFLFAFFFFNAKKMFVVFFCFFFFVLLSLLLMMVVAMKAPRDAAVGIIVLSVLSSSCLGLLFS